MKLISQFISYISKLYLTNYSYANIKRKIKESEQMLTSYGMAGYGCIEDDISTCSNYVSGYLHLQ